MKQASDPSTFGGHQFREHFRYFPRESFAFCGRKVMAQDFERNFRSAVNLSQTLPSTRLRNGQNLYGNELPLLGPELQGTQRDLGEPLGDRTLLLNGHVTRV